MSAPNVANNPIWLMICVSRLMIVRGDNHWHLDERAVRSAWQLQCMFLRQRQLAVEGCLQAVSAMIFKRNTTQQKNVALHSAGHWIGKTLPGTGRPFGKFAQCPGKVAESSGKPSAGPRHVAPTGARFWDCFSCKMLGKFGLCPGYVPSHRECHCPQPNCLDTRK